jgi:periplasmic divalent cation tolerance protein
MDKHFVEIRTTSDDQDPLRKIAAALVESKLAACVQIGGPILSTYKWQGKMESKKEWVLTAKSISYLLQNATLAIKEHHNYDEPEIIATRFEVLSDGYAIWLVENLAE